MNVKSRRLRRVAIRPALGWLIFLTLLLLALPRLGNWVLHKLRPAVPSSDPKFEVAYQAVLSLSDRLEAGGFSSYGINQLDYDRWRQLNGKPIKDLAEIQPDEVKAIYQTQWQSGDCHQYAPPLDLTCLDSVISFGVARSRSFFVDLPTEPQQAALEVTSRRELFRRNQVRPPITPSKQIALREGLRRDHALADLLVDLPRLAPDPTSDPSNAANSLSAQQIYQQVKPSTVEIWNNSQRGIASTATGIILSPDGLVLTNYHVIETNQSPQIKLSDGRKFSGRIASIDPELDLAMIQLMGARGLPTSPLAADTSQVKTGDTVYAIGSPKGESWKMSRSQVIELNSTCANGTSPLRCIRTPGGFLFPGNSGGPLINTAGQVIGLNRAVQQSTGEGVSIPVETIKSFLDRRMGQPSPINPTNPIHPPLNPPINPGNQQRRWL